MIERILAATLLLVCTGPLSANGLFFDDTDASPFDHDRIGQYAAGTFVSVCGDQAPEASQAALVERQDWHPTEDESPPGVLLRQQENFAGEPGLTAVFRVGRHACTLTLPGYRANARAGDEFAYGMSEALAKVFGDAETGWSPTQVITGLHRIDPAGRQLEQTLFLQWLQRGDLPAIGYFAAFDVSPDRPRVMLGRRTFNGRVIFGMADSVWERRRNEAGKPLLIIQGKDPVDTREGGYNTVAISRNPNGAIALKAWLHIGPPRRPFRMRSALGSAPLTGAARLTALVDEGGATLTRTLDSRPMPEIRARDAMLARGLYPVYLELDATALPLLASARRLTLVLERIGGSEIHLQIPAGEALRPQLTEHLGLEFR